MRMLSQLQRNRNFWFITAVLFLFFLLRLPSLFEPYWYGDEGIYQVIGSALRQDKLLYKDIWDNKPPFLYLLYSVLNSDQFLIRLSSLAFGILSIFFFFLLSKKIFPSVSFFTTLLFSLLFGLPLLEGNIANAENFMILPIITAAFLIYSLIDKHKPKATHLLILLIAGLLLSVAFLTKVVAIFDFAAFFLFLSFINFPFSKMTRQKLILFTSGFLFPILLTAVFFLAKGTFGDFLEATLFSNIGYVSYANRLINPFDLLLGKILALLAFSIFLFKKRKLLKPGVLFVLLWFGFSLFNAFFSERPFTHYLLVIVPSFSLMAGLILFSKKERTAITFLFIAAFILILKLFPLYGYTKTFLYYQNFLSFISGQKSLHSYQSFFDKKTPIDYELTLFLKPKIQKNETVFIYGNNAQLYKMLGVLPPGRYIVAYHIGGGKEKILETKIALSNKKPQFIVLMPDQKSFPFPLIGYREKANIENALIYERIF